MAEFRKEVDCAEACTVPAGIVLTEVPRPRHDWGDVVVCPNSNDAGEECGRAFMAREVKDDG